MFQSVFPSIIRRSRLYIQQQVYVKQVLQPACFTHFRHAAPSLFYFPQNAFDFIVYLFQFKNLTFFIKHAVRFKYHPYFYSKSNQMHQFLKFILVLE